MSPNIRTGGFGGAFQDSEFTRDIFKVDATKFLAGHELKAGVDWELQDSSIDRYAAGGGMINYRLTHVGGVDLSPPPVLRRTIGRPASTRTCRRPGSRRSRSITEPKTDNNSFYVQDSWRAASNFTINAGIRWERQKIGDRAGETAIDLTDNWAPRLGVVWDFARNGRSKLFANWGRFYESIPMDINIRAFGGEATCFCYNFDPSADELHPRPERAGPLEPARRPRDAGRSGPQGSVLG